MYIGKNLTQPCSLSFTILSRIESESGKKQKIITFDMTKRQIDIAVNFVFYNFLAQITNRKRLRFEIKNVKAGFKETATNL